MQPRVRSCRRCAPFPRPPHLASFIRQCSRFSVLALAAGAIAVAMAVAGTPRHTVPVGPAGSAVHAAGSGIAAASSSVADPVGNPIGFALTSTDSTGNSDPACPDDPWFDDEEDDDDDELSRDHVVNVVFAATFTQPADLRACADPTSPDSRTRANQFLLETVRRL